MHPYSTNSVANPKLIAFIALASSGASVGIARLIELLNSTIGWTIGSVSALSCFGILYFIFDRWLWRWPLARRVLLVPDLNGEWDCTGKITQLNGTPTSTPWHGTMTIRQSWSRMVVRLRTSQSESHSAGASLYQEPGNGFRLMYHYDNRPSVGQQSLSRHSGHCDLLFREDGASATGDYFTGQGRLTVGSMMLIRKEKHDGTA